MQPDLGGRRGVPKPAASSGHTTTSRPSSRQVCSSASSTVFDEPS
ncbi:unnamed protein product [Burkholderia pseudomallei]|nr:unnamed protein product [Burkholderia pseudomallei]